MEKQEAAQSSRIPRPPPTVRHRHPACAVFSLRTDDQPLIHHAGRSTGTPRCRRPRHPAERRQVAARHLPHRRTTASISARGRCTKTTAEIVWWVKGLRDSNPPRQPDAACPLGAASTTPPWRRSASRGGRATSRAGCSRHEVPDLPAGDQHRAAAATAPLGDVLPRVLPPAHQEHPGRQRRRCMKESSGALAARRLRWTPPIDPLCRGRSAPSG